MLEQLDVQKLFWTSKNFLLDVQKNLLDVQKLCWTKILSTTIFLAKMLRLWCALARRATSASHFHVALRGGALDFDEVQTVETLMPWLWAVQMCKFSKAEEAKTPATMADAQQDCTTEDFPRIRPLRGYHHAIKQKT